MKTETKVACDDRKYVCASQAKTNRNLTQCRKLNLERVGNILLQLKGNFSYVYDSC